MHIAHTLYDDEKVKDVFYEKLNLIVSKLPYMTSFSFWVTSMGGSELITTFGLLV